MCGFVARLKPCLSQTRLWEFLIFDLRKKLNLHEKKAAIFVAAFLIGC
jgi:hypothetical protein